MWSQTVQRNSPGEFGTLDVGYNFSHSFLNLLWYLVAWLKLNQMDVFFRNKKEQDLRFSLAAQFIGSPNQFFFVSVRK